MTKQELARRIADIEGVKGIDAIVYIEALVSLMDGKNSVLQIGKSFLWDLMVKHKVDKHQHKINPDMCMIGIGHNFIVATDETLPTAILECIVEANPQ